ncbi:MAG: hypothetical protein AUJ12_01825 [Alphaproteobacteria bacterium CG1_02_46_17]|nr:MAG: hypothetical protein AUJ12_01825 [Alphaproteobacteria bacterium CG1_02_46_17]
MKNICIIGAGFAAISAIKHLRKHDKDLQITLISASSDFLYYPSLIWIPTKLRKGKDLTFSLSNFLRKNNVKFVRGNVSTISNGGRQVILEDNTAIENDALIIATGAKFIKSISGIENTYTLCEGLGSAEAISRKLDSLDSGVISFGFSGNPKEITALRGGPIFELMFGVDTYLRGHKDRNKFTLKFFSPAEKPGIRLGEKAYNGLIQSIKEKGIEIASLGAKLVEFSANEVVTEKTKFLSDLTIFMPGLTGPDWLKSTNLPLSEGGMILADKHARVLGFQKTYAIGDCASYDAPDWAPKQAHMADIQGKAAALNCLSDLNGEIGLHTFNWELACIIDTLDGGTLVYRTQKHSVVISSWLLHWVKIMFEKYYIWLIR